MKKSPRRKRHAPQYWYDQCALRLNSELKAEGFPVISGAEIRAFMEARPNRCEACGTVLVRGGCGVKAYSVALDHDHMTGKLRGVLCNRCNRCLGLFKDSPKVIRKVLCHLN